MQRLCRARVVRTTNKTLRSWVAGVMASCLIFVSACGGGGPSAPTPPTFPSMLGTWMGRLSSVGTQRRNGQPLSTQCDISLAVTSQTRGAFSGTFQLPTCGQAGTVNGEVDSAGRLSRFSVTQTVGPAGCERVSGDPNMTGVVTGTSLSLQRTQTVLCLGVELVDRNQVLTATRQ